MHHRLNNQIEARKTQKRRKMIVNQQISHLELVFQTKGKVYKAIKRMRHTQQLQQLMIIRLRLMDFPKCPKR